MDNFDEKEFAQSNEYLDYVLEKEKSGEEDLTPEERLIYAIYRSYSELSAMIEDCETSTNESQIQSFTIEWMRDAVNTLIDEIRGRS